MLWDNPVGLIEPIQQRGSQSSRAVHCEERVIGR